MLRGGRQGEVMLFIAVPWGNRAVLGALPLTSHMGLQMPSLTSVLRTKQAGEMPQPAAQAACAGVSGFCSGFCAWKMMDQSRQEPSSKCVLWLEQSLH